MADFWHRLLIFLVQFIFNHTTTDTGSHHQIQCKDINRICQIWASNGNCSNTDFVRHFCPISCRNPSCSHHFPTFTTKQNNWHGTSFTICQYPNLNPSISPNLYFNQILNISLNQCQTHCNDNLLCSHFIYIDQFILAQNNYDYHNFIRLQSPKTTRTNTQSINMCIHSYIPSTLCHPICIDIDIVSKYLKNTKLDKSTPKTSSLIPFIYSREYSLISPFSLYTKHSQPWNTMNDFNVNQQISPYKYHEYYYPNTHMITSPKLETFISGSTKVRLEFESRVDRNLSVYWVNTRNQKEIFQESLDANAWNETKARHSFNSHIFVIRDTESNEWIATYKNNKFHQNVLITITPFGVCVCDQTKSKNEEKEEESVKKLLSSAKQKRWSTDADIVGVWRLYEEILWMTNNTKTIGKVLNLMGQIFLFGAYEQTFDYDIAWKYFEMASMLNNGDAMYNMAYMIEQKFVQSHMYHQSAMPNYWCGAQAQSEKSQLLLGFRYLNGIKMNKSCENSLFFYETLAEKVRFDGRGLDIYPDLIDLADPPKDGKNFRIDEHELRFYQQNARRGLAWANNAMGQAYLFGLRGMAQNIEMAANHFEAAVAANDAIAANYLGRMYWSGHGKPKDMNRTLELFEFAANENVSAAQNNLAYIYYKGRDAPRNMTAALYWFNRAADADFSQAMFYLAAIHQDGEYGVEQNISLAVKWYTLASEQKHFRSMYELALLYKNGDGVERDCQKAVRLFKYVAEYDNVKFELENGRSAYESGQYEQSFVLFSQKAEEGYLNGQINAAYLADYGYHKDLYDSADDGFIQIPRNKELAFRYYGFAASQNHSRSLRILGDYFWYQWIENIKDVVGNVINMNVSGDDYGLACSLYEMAAMQYDGQSMYDLAYCYEYGRGKVKNISKAREIYLDAWNKSSDAYVPVLIAMAKMELVNICSMSTMKISIASIENAVLAVSTGLLVIVLLIKIKQNMNVHQIQHEHHSGE